MGAAAIVAGASAGATGIGNAMSGNQQGQALRTQLAEERLKTIQENNIKDDQISRIISAQTAQEAARGVAPGSASFAAIQSESFNQFSEDRQARALDLAFKSAGIKEQEDQIRRTLTGAAWGNPIAAIQLLGPSAISNAASSASFAMASKKDTSFGTKVTGKKADKPQPAAQKKDTTSSKSSGSLIS